MLYVPAIAVSEAFGVSRGLVARWVQTGWLRPAGQLGSVADDTLLEFAPLAEFAAGRGVAVDWVRLRYQAVEQAAEPHAAADRGLISE